MGDKEDGSSIADDLFHSLHAAILKLLVPDRENLVNDQDLGLQEGGHRERKLHIHAARVALHRGIDEILHTGEGDDLVELGRDFSPGHAEDGAIHEDVIPAGQIGVEASPYLEEAADAAIDLDAPGAGSGDAGDELQECGFPCTIGTDDADGLPLLDVEGDVLQSIEEVRGLRLLLGLGLGVSEGVGWIELPPHPPADITKELATVDLSEAVDLGNVLD